MSCLTSRRIARRTPLWVGGACLALCACGSSTPSGSDGSGGGDPTTPSNVMSVQVSLGPTGHAVNGLFASVRICVPGTSTCQTIDNVLVDTGSEGLRLLGSAVTLTLPPVNDTIGNRIWNCASFADGSYTWGPIATADIHLGSEVAPDVPIQLVSSSSLPAAPTVCSAGGTPINTVQALGANGLIGVGLFRQDCGSLCTTNPPAPVYFACTSTCGVITVPVAQQLQNPVAALTRDNTGLVLTLPVLAAAGAPTANGTLTFGVGTRSNNSLGSTPVYTASTQGTFTTEFQSQSLTSFLDTGSNGLFFLTPRTIGLPTCSSSNSSALGFSCPTQTVSYSATNIGANSARSTVTFSVANAESLFASGNAAFNNLAGPDAGFFDWGLPFFFGRSVYLAIEGAKTPGGVGPFWAY